MTGLLLLAPVLATTAAFRLLGSGLSLPCESVGTSVTSALAGVGLDTELERLTSSVLKRAVLPERPNDLDSSLHIKGCRVATTPDGELSRALAAPESRSAWFNGSVPCRPSGGELDFGFFSIGGGRGGGFFLFDTVDSVSVSSASPALSSMGKFWSLESDEGGPRLEEMFVLSACCGLWNVPRLREDRGDCVGVVLI